MIKNLNLSGTYSGHTLRFPDGRELVDLSPGIRGTSTFIVTQVENDGKFKLRTIPGSEERYSTCRITGHYPGRESQPTYIYCNDVNPLLGVDKAPERQPVTVGEPLGEAKFQAAKRLLESSGYLLESRKNLDTFLSYLEQNNGVVPMDEGKNLFIVKRLNADNYDFSGYNRFLEQIKSEGLYDRVYVGTIVPTYYLKDGKVPVNLLPIFGRSDRYETKWLMNYSVRDAVSDVMSERRIGLKSRLDYFKIPADEALSLNDLGEKLRAANIPASVGHSRKGDYLETNTEFTKEECDKWHSIPTGRGTLIVWLKNNKFVIDKSRFSTVEKAFDFIQQRVNAE